MVSFSCRISPLTLTVIFFDKSPPAIAVDTSAMLRTWAVRFDAMKLTLSVKSFQVPPTPGTCAWPPSLPSVPTSRATRVTSEAKAFSWSTIVLMVSLSSRISPRTSTVILRQVAARDRGSHMGNVAHLIGEVAAHGIHRVGQILPGTGDAGHNRLTAELAIGAHLTRDARDFGSERAQLIDHRIDGLLQLQDLAAYVDGDLFRQIAVGHRDRHFRDIA